MTWALDHLIKLASELRSMAQTPDPWVGGSGALAEPIAKAARGLEEALLAARRGDPGGLERAAELLRSAAEGLEILAETRSRSIVTHTG